MPPDSLRRWDVREAAYRRGRGAREDGIGLLLMRRVLLLLLPVLLHDAPRDEIEDRSRGVVGGRHLVRPAHARRVRRLVVQLWLLLKLGRSENESTRRDGLRRRPMDNRQRQVGVGGRRATPRPCDLVLHGVVLVKGVAVQPLAHCLMRPLVGGDGAR